MLELLYFSLFLLMTLLCCNAVIGAVLMLHLLRRWRNEERREVVEDLENFTLMGSVQEIRR
tara:strand:+ start:805 stop:987 length:183 start_codon:yes stop_codon:yes gene_type:complete